MSDKLRQVLATTAQTQTQVREIALMFNTIEAKVMQAMNEDPFPKRFAGVADNYRYTTGPKGSMPTHRFEVLCGNGLFIHVEATPEQFAKMMVNMDMGDITPKRVNNKIIVVERVKDKGMVPLLMVAEEPLEVQDKWGNYLWRGCKVKFPATGETGIVPDDVGINYGEGGVTYIGVNISDGEGEETRLNDRYTKDMVLSL